MTREILFRGLRVDGGGWAYGDYLSTSEIREYHDPKDESQFSDWLVHPHTVGQFTGLLDKNGVKVFEGDKIHSKYWNPSVYKVIFEDGEFCFVSLDGIEEPYTNSISYVFDFEIIGNIHEETQL
jgi:uncharacterized phage protein (TIGR01671 family)